MKTITSVDYARAQVRKEFPHAEVRYVRPTSNHKAVFSGSRRISNIRRRITDVWLSAGKKLSRRRK